MQRVFWMLLLNLPITKQTLSNYQFRITVVTSFQNVLVPCDKKYKSIDVGVLIA